MIAKSSSLSAREGAGITSIADSSSAKAKTAAEWIQPAAFEECVKKCVKEGSTPVFVTEDNKILKVDAASSDKITQYLGHKVSVTGKVEGGTLKMRLKRVNLLDCDAALPSIQLFL